MKRAFTAAAALTLAIACSPIAAPTGSSARVDGTWNYIATNSAAPLVVSGSLSLTPRNGSSFGGSLDATEAGDPTGERRVVGIVTGRMLDSALVDFDLDVAGAELRHVGTLRGDSLVGTWVETSSVGIVASGAFRARRISR